MREQGILSSFKAYDIRGRVPDELDEELSYYLGLALAAEFSPRLAVLGRDVRLSGRGLAAAMTRALLEQGTEVVDTGICGTEEIYFATATRGFDLGIMFTASHNPAEYNGIKLVRKGAAPISGDSGLSDLRDRVLYRRFASGAASPGVYREQSFRDEYVDFLRANLRLPLKKNFKIVMNPGNGCAGYVLEKLLPFLPVEALLIHSEPDGTFPGGVPNPLLPEKRQDTAGAVCEQKADLGLAWDGDFDRCFFYDAEGGFVESYYLIGLLAGNLLAGYPGGKILHDTRLIWNTIDLVVASGGIPVQCKTGHAFMKERMRREEALYGGEMSAHHYFGNFSCCDSGMLPWLKLLGIMDSSGASLAELVVERAKAYPCSGEINFRLEDVSGGIKYIHDFFSPEIAEENHIDGLSADCGQWRFNLRSSNTEPLLRLNVESRANRELMAEKTARIGELLCKFGAKKSNV
jgi:phosphomannomutase